MTNTGYILVEIVTEETACDDDYYNQEYEVKNTICHSYNKEELEQKANELNQSNQKISEKLSNIETYIRKYNTDFNIQFTEMSNANEFDSPSLLTLPNFIPRTAQEHKQRKEIKDHNQKIKNEFLDLKRRKEEDFVEKYKIKNPISKKLENIVKFFEGGQICGNIVFLNIEKMKIEYVVEEFANSYVEKTCEKLKAIWD